MAAIDASMINDIAVVRGALETIAAKAIAADKDGVARQALQVAWDEAAMRVVSTAVRCARPPITSSPKGEGRPVVAGEP